MSPAETGSHRVGPAEVEGWFSELGLTPSERADREGIASWDLILDGRRRFDLRVTVILDPAVRGRPEKVADLWLSVPGGGRLQLKQVADVYLSDGRFLIAHEGGTRRLAVTCNVSGRDVASFVDEARKTIEAKVKLPAGVYVSFSGAAEEDAAQFLREVSDK